MSVRYSNILKWKQVFLLKRKKEGTSFSTPDKETSKGDLSEIEYPKRKKKEGKRRESILGFPTN